MSTIDQQFIEYIVKSVVGHPDDVVVERIIDEKGVLLSLTVNPEDLGRVIGKRGVTAQSLRTLLRALGTKNDARYNLKIVNNDDDREHYTISSDDTNSTSEPSADNSHDDTNGSDEETSAPVNNSTETPVDNASDYSKKTREELAELDDLDI
ncbi:KH domain-containing protein [Patescibacteria group bacterium]|nr:MAG: KH domain-containing protein [Patescibacteria group bacterium]